MSTIILLISYPFKPKKYINFKNYAKYKPFTCIIYFWFILVSLLLDI